MAGEPEGEREKSSVKATTELREEFSPKYGTEHRLDFVLH